MRQTIKLNENRKNFIVKTLFLMLIMTLGFTLICLYDPIKKLICGETITLTEFFSYIELKRQIPIIIAIPIAINFKELKKKQQ